MDRATASQIDSKKEHRQGVHKEHKSEMHNYGLGSNPPKVQNVFCLQRLRDEGMQLVVDNRQKLKGLQHYQI